MIAVRIASYEFRCVQAVQHNNINNSYLNWLQQSWMKNDGVGFKDSLDGWKLFFLQWQTSLSHPYWAKEKATAPENAQDQHCH